MRYEISVHRKKTQHNGKEAAEMDWARWMKAMSDLLCPRTERDELALEWMAVTHHDVRRDSLRRLCFQLNYWMSIWSQLPEGLRRQYTWSEHFPALLPRRLSVDRLRIRTRDKMGKTIFMRIFAIIEIMMDIYISISTNEQWLFSKLC